ncbi:MAG: M10 family metallopeptidase C-terminal domain-containing protein [Hyphomicrobium sp.]
MPGLVIDEIYGGGGSTAGLPNADYVVIHNTSNASIDMTGYALQVSNGGGGVGGMNNPFTVIALSGSVAAFGYFLIQVSAAGGTGVALPTPDLVSGTLVNMGANNGRVALTSDTTQLANNPAPSSGGAILDFVGFGTSAASFEGAGVATAPSNSTSIQRTAANGWDTNNNNADFVAAAPAPKNSATSPVNAPPTFTNSSTANVAENATGTVLDVTAFDPEGDTEGAGLTYSIVANVSDDSAKFAINATTGALTFLAAPNFEAGSGTGATLNHYVLTVRVLDNGGGLAASTDQAVTVIVSDVNEAPTAVALTGTTATIAENTSTAARIKVGDIAITDDALGSNTLAVAGADAAFFEISGTELFLKAGTVLDFETKASYAITVTVDDAGVGAGVDATTATYLLSLSNVSPETQTGNNGANTLIGGTDIDILSGLGGNDRLIGGAAADILTGGTGRDVMTGDADRDVFDFNLIGELGKTAATRDVITDFRHLVDDIDLSGLDARAGVAGNQAFTFLTANGAAFTGVKGQLHWQTINLAGTASDKTIIEGDTNGDKVADFQIELKGLIALSKADFIL